MSRPTYIKANNIFKVDVLLVVLFFTIQLIQYLYTQVRGINGVLFVFIAWFSWVHIVKKDWQNIYIVLMRRKYETVSFFLFIITVFLSYVFQNDSAKAYGYLVNFSIMFMILIIDAYYSRKDSFYRMSIFWGCVIVLAIQALISIPYLIEYPGVSRGVTSGQLVGTMLHEALRNGVGNFGVYATTVLFLFLILIYNKNIENKLIKYFTYCLMIILFIPVTLATYAAPVVLLVIGVATYLLWSFRKIIFSAKSIVILFLFIGAMTLSFNYLSEETEFLNQFNRKTELAFSSSDIQDPTGRLELLDSSINSFIQNPFFGIGVPDWGSYDLIGEHSFWIDLFAHYGLIGGAIFYLFLFLRIYRRIKFKKDLTVNAQRKLIIVGLIIFGVMNFINPTFMVANNYVLFLFFLTGVNYR